MAASSVAEARSAPDGSTVTIEAVALTGSDFHDGGGFVADATGGIAVLITDGAFARGEFLRVSGEIDDRFSQRTLRADGGSLVRLGTASEPAPVAASTGTVGEGHEGRLVRIGGAILGSPTTLTTGLAFDVDDGSGATRVVVGSATGIDTAEWLSGATLELVGVAGQRDSSGSGTDGYRVLARDSDDVIGVNPPAASPEPTPSAGGASPTPSPAPGAEGVTPIAEARQAAKDARLRIRGVVTLPTGLVDDRTAVVQDATGAILLRLGEDDGRLTLGQRVEVDGKRSTLSGMESLRVVGPIVSLGTAAEPAARQVRTGEAGEGEEATLVVARGAIVASARRSSSGTVSLEIDDGSGPLRVSLAARLRADRDSLVAGTWVEVRGVLGQDTTRSKPAEGYRIWPRSSGEVRVTAPAAGGNGLGDGGSGGPVGGPSGSLGDLEAADLAQLRIGATLVIGRWKELGIGGILWDGDRLVGVHASSGDVVRRLMRQRRPPLALDLGGLQAAGTERAIGAPIVKLGAGTGQTVVLDTSPAPPRATLAGDLPAWVSVVGKLSRSGSRRILLVDGERVPIHDRCADEDDDDRDRHGVVSVTGVALGDPLRLLVPCGGVRLAPSIAGGGAHVAFVGSAAAGPTSPASAAGPRDADHRQPVVAGLLIAAATALAGGAVLARRRSRGDPEPAAATELDDASASGARLTLIRVPHEGGP